MPVIHVPADQILSVPGPTRVQMHGGAVLGAQSAMPVPTVGSISPNGAVHGAAATSMTVTGTNFFPSSVILWGGAPVDTVFISPTQMRTTLSAAQLATAGTVVVKARNGSIDSAAGQNFTIT
jgi:trimeric autotransporter adhesin